MGKSNLEQALLSQIRIVGLPMPEREFRAIPKRRFKWDFAYPDRKLLIEVQGGIWAGKYGKQSGHTSGTGLNRDYEKNNLAVCHGYKVLYFTSNMIESGEAVSKIEEAMNE